PDDTSTSSGEMEWEEQSEPVTQVEPDDTSTSSGEMEWEEQSELVTQVEPGDSSTSSDAMEWEEQGEVEYQDIDQEEQVADVPSLEEYLSGYTCGFCRRNCSLDNPRCHNGSRLAQAKAEEYHNIYG
ncbi:MAG: hypothetical protein Q4A07_13300, partial [Coriobacteriales bacterium]|nr:hypothetical protein [Coriobacteriales bacterium]